MDYESLWKKCLEGVSEHVSAQHFATWFSPIKPTGGDDDGSIALKVPNRFFLEWIKEHYLLLIQEVLRRDTGTDFRISWTVGDERSGAA
ncbi:MAG: DnaA N-terminal domain-containing protein, partial [Thermodesulfobacteriota bacterium]